MDAPVTGLSGPVNFGSDTPCRAPPPALLMSGIDPSEDASGETAGRSSGKPGRADHDIHQTDRGRIFMMALQVRRPRSYAAGVWKIRFRRS